MGKTFFLCHSWGIEMSPSNLSTRFSSLDLEKLTLCPKITRADIFISDTALASSFKMVKTVLKLVITSFKKALIPMHDGFLVSSINHGQKRHTILFTAIIIHYFSYYYKIHHLIDSNYAWVACRIFSLNWHNPCFRLLCHFLGIFDFWPPVMY